MTKREQVIQFLNFKYKNSTSNIVAIGINDLETINLSEQEVVQILCLLAEDKLIRIINRSVDDDFNRYWKVALTVECVDYFVKRRKKKGHILWEFTKFLIPTIISAIALLKSFCIF